MDAYLFSTFLAEDLVTSLICEDKLISLEIKNSVKKIYENDLEGLEMSLNFRSAVFNLMAEECSTVRSYCRDFLYVYRKGITISDFNSFATDTALKFFKEGYSPALFIAYCAVIIELAILCHERNLDNVFEQAIGLISTILIAHVLVYQSTGGEKAVFASLAKQASRFNKGLEKFNRAKRKIYITTKL
ncbi:hypothetical protein NPIL_344751 [Nephila pilipes]|uniref:Uncharacterized protein n=1 Tax=Nephila pilipes TaxID=299642 RepID=A0A8X6MSR1_NEPPI|nr:hypothetical protein NPIL_344751 [Nephila pilipes]